MNQYIDHTILKATATENDVKLLCEQAKKYNFFAVCVNPAFVGFCKKLLADSDVKICTVVGFPLGANTTAVKAFETIEALREGADEIDMVINLGWAKEGNFDKIEEEIRHLKELTQEKTLKVIIETCYLTEAEKQAICLAAVRAGANFVKTSTGFGTGGATLADVQLMKQTVGNAAEVKASGGVQTKADADAFIAAGATRIGTSKGIMLVEGGQAQQGY